ncbi:hypothetical protein [Kaarinaea lacus]
MKQISAVARESTASEAIISNDGRVKRRIPNYETVVINIAEDDESSSNVLGAINDYAEIPVLLDSVEIGHQSNVSSKKNGLLVLGVIVFITFLWSMYSLFFLQDTQRAVPPEQPTPSATYNIDHTQKIKQLSDLILQDNNWDDLRLNSILQHWNNLNAFEHKELKSLSWFQHFKYTLGQQVKQFSKTETSSTLSPENTNLHKLAVAIEAINQHGQQIEKTNGSDKYEALVDAIKNEIAEAEVSSKQSKQSIESEEKLNSMLRQELATPHEESNRITVTDAAINILLGKYQTAYENGNLSDILNLFGLDLSTDASNQLIANFENVFRNTSKRSINFYDYSWEPTANGAVITSQYNAMLEFANKRSTQHIVTSVKIIARQKGNLLQISSFELQNSKVSAIAPKLDLSEEIEPLKNSESITEIPNAAQLQDLTTQLVSAYETGDIDRFTALFSADAKTNDRMNLAGVREDYNQLFQTSTDRQMFIQNLKWVDVANGAKGTGDLEVIVLSNNTNTVYNMKGKIQIVAQRMNGKTLITHLYHIERKQ